MRQMTRRHRLRYAIAVVVVIVAGLLSRCPLAAHWPDFLQMYAGDTLWALALFLSLGLIFAKTPTAIVAILSLATAYGIELSQLYQAPWINRLRDTTLGALVLGFGFKWTDLLCYTAGVALGAATERASETLSTPPTKKKVDSYLKGTV